MISTFLVWLFTSFGTSYEFSGYEYGAMGIMGLFLLGPVVVLGMVSLFLESMVFLSRRSGQMWEQVLVWSALAGLIVWVGIFSYIFGQASA